MQLDLLLRLVLLVSWTLVPLSRAVPVAQEEGAPGPPWAAAFISRGHYSSKHTYWTITGYRSPTTSDGVWVRTRLESLADHRLRFEPVKEPIVELTGPGEQVRRLALSQFSPRGARVLRDPLPSESLHEAEFALTTGFGPLQAGGYKLRIFWPADSARLQSWDGPVVGEQSSPALEFQVVEAPLESVRKRLREGAHLDGFKQPTPVMIQRVDPPRVLPGEAQSPPRGVFVNTTERVLLVPHFSPIDDRGIPLPVDPPLRVPLTMYRWIPDGPPEPVGWRRMKAQGDPAGLVKHEVKPGERVEIILHDWRAEWDGIYYFQLAVYDVLGRPHVIISEPFVVRYPVERAEEAAMARAER